MKCSKCTNDISIDDFFHGSISPYIADGERHFFCVDCTSNQPERSKREDEVENPGKTEFVGKIRRMTRGQI